VVVLLFEFKVVSHIVRHCWSTIKSRKI